MDNSQECIIDCNKYLIRICGKNLDFISQVQADYKKKHKRHLSVEKAIISVITKVRENQ